MLLFSVNKQRKVFFAAIMCKLCVKRASFDDSGSVYVSRNSSVQVYAHIKITP